MKLCYVLVLLLSFGSKSVAIYCYQCTAATPGCGTPFNWRGVGYLGSVCPDPEDVCVKLIQQKDAQEVITRDCLSNFKPFHMDIPADTYEGCRPAKMTDMLAHYVNNSIKELDIKRDWYDKTTWCFCFLDHRCNGASILSLSTSIFALTIIIIKSLM